MSTIDLNADVGEVDVALDARIIDVVSSVSIACGGHAGDDETMTAVATLAASRGVRIGAHPSYVDREGFGRTRQHLPHTELLAQLRDQIQRLAANSPAPVEYVKPHGALYHAAAVDDGVAHAVVTAADGLPLMGQPGARYVTHARAAGLRVILEGFADRAYSDDGRLVPRTLDKAVLADHGAVLEQVTGLARGEIRSVNGQVVTLRADSVCVHSDTPGAADLAHLIAAHLGALGIDIRARP